MALPKVGARAEVANMAIFRRDISEVNRSVTGFTGRVAGAFSGAARSVTSLGTQMVMVGTTMKRIGTALTFYVTLPLVMLGKAAASAAIDFESGMVGIAKTTNLTVSELELLRKKILDLTMDQDSYISGLPDAGKKMTKFGEIAGSMGIEGVEAILAFAETASLLEVTTDIIGEDAVRDMAKFIKIAGLSADETDELGSAMVNLGNSLPTTERQILLVATRLAPIAGLMGLNAQETLAWGAAMASAGVRTQMGASAMSRVMIDVQAAVSGTTDKVKDNTKAMADMEKKIGRQTEALVIDTEILAAHHDELAAQRAMYGDLEPGVRRHINRVADLERVYSNNTEDLEANKKELEKLRGEHGKIVSSGNLQEIARLAGMTGKEFKQAWEVDASAAFKAFIGGLHDVHESGEDVFAVLDKLNINNIRDIQTIGTLAKTYNNLDEALRLAEEGWTGVTAAQQIILDNMPEMYEGLTAQNFLMQEAAKRDKTTAAQLAKLGNTLKGVAIVLGDVFLPIINDVVAMAIPFVKRITELDEKWIKWGIGIGIAAAALGPFLAILGTAISLFGLMLGPLGLVAAAIGGLAWLWTDSFDDIWAAADDAWYYMETYVFTPLIDAIEYLKVTLLPGFKKDWKDTWDAIVNKANDVWTWLSINVFGPLSGAIAYLYAVALPWLKTKWEESWGALQTAAETVWGALNKNVFIPLGEAIESIARDITNKLRVEGGFEPLITGAYNFGQTIETTDGKVTTFTGNLVGAGTGMYSYGVAVETVGGYVVQFGEKVDETGGLLDNFAADFETAFGKIGTPVEALLNQINTQLIPAVTNLLSSFIEAVAGVAPSVPGSLGAALGDLAGLMSTSLSEAITAITALFNSMAAALRGEWKLAWEEFKVAIVGPEDVKQVDQYVVDVLLSLERIARWVHNFATEGYRGWWEAWENFRLVPIAAVNRLISELGELGVGEAMKDFLKGFEEAGGAEAITEIVEAITGEEGLIPAIKELASTLGTATTEIIGYLEKVTQFWSPTWEALKKTVDEVIVSLGGAKAAAEEAAGGVSSFEEAGEESISFWEGYGRVVGTAFSIIGEMVTDAIGGFTNFVQTITALIEGDWARAWENFKALVLGAIAVFIPGVSAEGLVEIVNNGVNSAIEYLTGDGLAGWAKAWENYQLIPGALLTYLKDVVWEEIKAAFVRGLIAITFNILTYGKPVVIALGVLADELGLDWRKAWDGIENTVTDVFKNIKTWVDANWATHFQPILDFINKIRGTFEEVEEDVSKFSIVPRMIGDIKDEFQDMDDSVTDSIGSIETRFLEFAGEVSTALEDMALLAEAFGQALEDIPTDITTQVNLNFRATMDRIGRAFIDIENLNFDQTITITGRGGREVYGSYAQGGIVPGPLGAAQMAVVHGGEIIIPPGALSFQGGTGFMELLLGVVQKFSIKLGGLFATLGSSLTLSIRDITEAIGNAERIIADATREQERLTDERTRLEDKLADLRENLAGREAEIITKREKQSLDLVEKEASLAIKRVEFAKKVGDAEGEQTIAIQRASLELQKMERDVSEMREDAIISLKEMEVGISSAKGEVKEHEEALVSNQSALQQATKTIDETMAVMRQIPGTMLEVQAVMEKAANTQSAFTDAQKKFTKLNEDIAAKRKRLAIDEFEIGTRQLSLEEAILEATKAKPGDELRAQIRVRRAQASLEKERLAVEKATAEIKSMEIEVASTNHEINILGKTLDKLKWAGGVVGGPRGPFYNLVIAAITEAIGGRSFSNGGLVSGRRGQPQLAIVHGGERIIPMGVGGGGGGGGASYNYNTVHNNTYNANYGQTQQYGSLRRDLYRWTMLNQGVA